MIKRFSAIFLCAVMALLSLTGCTANGEKSESSAKSSTAIVANSSTNSSANSSKNSLNDGKTQINFTVKYQDGTKDELKLSTSGRTLGAALYENKIISADEFKSGFVTTVNGVTADYNKDKSWWCLKDANGKDTTVGISEINISNGDSYSFEYTVG